MQKIVDFASDKRSELKKDQHASLMKYSMDHAQIVKANIDREMIEKSVAMKQQAIGNPEQTAAAGQPGAAPKPPIPGEAAPESEADNPGMSAGMSRAMNIAESAM